MGRKLNTEGIRDLLLQNYEHLGWDEVASRCLSCANCTMVCPTYFCSKVEDVMDITGEHAERWQKQDSCFTMDFSFLHGGSVRSSTRSRYRQWLTHKLATWIDQFDESGCTGFIDIKLLFFEGGQIGKNIYNKFNADFPDSCYLPQINGNGSPSNLRENQKKNKRNLFMKEKYKIVLLPGDDIGPEVI